MPGYDARYWAERTADHRRRRFPKFRGSQIADVVVIGGGLTGCASAYALASAGLDVVLLEADRLASGGTASGVGAILPEPDAWLRATEPAAGRRASRAAWQEARKGSADFGAMLKKLKIACDLTSTELVINATRHEQVAALKKEQAARQQAGIATPWLAAQAAAAEIGTETNGGLCLHDAFTFDPVRAALGLANAAATSGARICEQSPVRRTKFTRKIATVVLDSGAIQTKGIVVATGGPGALFSQLRRHVRVRDGYVVVTERMNAAMRKNAGRRRAVLTEAGDERPWLRWLTDDRALFAGGLQKPVPARLREKALRQRVAELMYQLSRRYPAISGLPAAWGWDVPVVSTVDGLPWIGPHRNYPFHFFAMALGWHGDGLSWFAAKAARRFFKGDATKDDEVMGFARHL